MGIPCFRFPFSPFQVPLFACSPFPRNPPPQYPATAIFACTLCRSLDTVPVHVPYTRASRSPPLSSPEFSLQSGNSAALRPRAPPYGNCEFLRGGTLFSQLCDGYSYLYPTGTQISHTNDRTLAAEGGGVGAKKGLLCVVLLLFLCLSGGSARYLTLRRPSGGHELARAPTSSWLDARERAPGPYARHRLWLLRAPCSSARALRRQPCAPSR